MASKQTITITIYSINAEPYWSGDNFYDMLCSDEQDLNIDDAGEVVQITLMDVYLALEHEWEAVDNLGFVLCSDCEDVCHENNDGSVDTPYWCDTCGRPICEYCILYHEGQGLNLCRSCYDSRVDEEKSKCKKENGD